MTILLTVMWWLRKVWKQAHCEVWEHDPHRSEGSIAQWVMWNQGHGTRRKCRMCGRTIWTHGHNQICNSLSCYLKWRSNG